MEANDLAASSNKKNNIHILHVDDDSSIREISKQILLEMGDFEIDNACCVDEAFKKLATKPYDVIISDFEMPQKNGLDFLKELRDQNNQISFILFTGKGREDVAVKALNLGADRYLNKNGSPEAVYRELADAVNKTVEIKKSAKLLAASESKYRTLVEKSLQGIMIAQNTPLRIVFANETMGKMLGYKPEEFTSLSPSEVAALVHHEDRKTFFNRFMRRLEGKEAESSYEFRAVRKDGSLIWMEAFASAIEYYGQPAVQSVFLDIDKRKKSEEAVKKSEARFRELANFLPEVVFETDLSGKITFFSQTSFEKTGYTPEEVEKGLNMLQFVVPQDLERAKENIRRRMTGEKTDSSEYTLFRKNGDTYPAIVKTAPIFSGNKLCGLRGLVIDITELREAEELLRKSEKKYRTLIEQSAQGLLLGQGPIPHVVFANNAMAKITGYSVQELSSLSLQQVLGLVHPDDRELFFERFKERLQGKPTPAQYEFRGIKKDGSTVWLELSSTLIEYQGQPTLQAIFADISERKKAEEELYQSETRYRELANYLPGIVFETDQKGQLEFANEKAEEVSGYSLREIKKGLNILEFLVPEDRERAIKSMQRLLAGGSYTPTEYTFLRKDGSTFPAIITATPRIHDGKITGFRGLVLDISERKHAEEKLKESEERSKAIIATSPIGIATSGADKQFLSANEAFCKILGYTEEELRKLTFKDITHPADFKESALKMEELENGKIPSFTLEKRYIKKDRSVIDGKVMVSEVSNRNGKPTLFVAELEDITERKKIEGQRKVLERKVNDYSKHLKYMVDLRTTQLKDANERLVKAERLAAIGELAGMIGHDLRNPLSGIKNATYLLKKKSTAISETQSKELLEIIDKAIEHSDKIINDLLEYARNMHLELTDSTLPTLLDAALRTIQVPDRIQILNHVNEEILIRVDADKIMRVFVNLIKNAIDAIPEKGTIEISSCKIKDCIEIVFSDTGAGISKETLSKIFTPLFTTKAQGMGFGLAICKRIVEAHGGTINVKTALDKGTTFTISWPTKPKRPSAENLTVMVK